MFFISSEVLTIVFSGQYSFSVDRTIVSGFMLLEKLKNNVVKIKKLAAIPLPIYQNKKGFFCSFFGAISCEILAHKCSAGVTSSS